MSERLFIKWNDFKDNAINEIANLRAHTDFTDVTLASADGEQIDAHKVILSAASPFFQNLLKGNKDAHPLIYMRGVDSEDLLALVDFFYSGEANIPQENLESFLKVAEELQLKGLMGKSFLGKSEEEDVENTSKQSQEIKPDLKKETILPSRSVNNTKSDLRRQISKSEKSSTAIALTSQPSAMLQELLQVSDSMMVKTERKMPNGKKVFKCKECGKEGEKGNIRQHIENNHLEGISVSCNFCEKIFRSRHLLSHHNQSEHKNFGFKTEQM